MSFKNHAKDMLSALPHMVTTIAGRIILNPSREQDEALRAFLLNI